MRMDEWEWTNGNGRMGMDEWEGLNRNRPTYRYDNEGGDEQETTVSTKHS